ncbi:MAG: acyltransferase [Clostridia bacterium]|nr:acyltransferase [Clostridia bacterium]
MEQKSYIPGFDWLRLVGCTLVVMAHCGMGAFFQNIIPTWLYGLFCEVVPVFFIISGYLMYRSITTKAKPVRYIMSYLWKYGGLFVVLNVIAMLIGYIEIYVKTGEWMIRSFFIHVLILPFYEAPMYQLWFIPALLVGIIVNAFFVLKRKERLGQALILLYTAIIMLWCLYGWHITGIPLYEAITSWEHFHLIDYFLTRSARGILYVAMGMWSARHDEQICKLPLQKLLWPALLITVVDTAVVARWGDPQRVGMTLSVSIWSFILFIGIRRLKGADLQPYHAAITIYSGTMYFLHVFQQKFFMRWTSNNVLIFLGVLLTNALLTWWLTNQMKKRKKLNDGL